MELRAKKNAPAVPTAKSQDDQRARDSRGGFKERPEGSQLAQVAHETLHLAAVLLPLVGLDLVTVPLFTAGHQILQKSIVSSEGGVYSKRPPNQGISALL
jgi:hypothetical protein